jgi:hypothetical protein
MSGGGVSTGFDGCCRLQGAGCKLKVEWPRIRDIIKDKIMAI